MSKTINTDVLVIGAGPAGSAASSILSQAGVSVTVMEKSSFPRFSIGESLLPQCMVDLKKAGLLEDVLQFGFQKKDGANFSYKDQFSTFLFSEKLTDGPSETLQVQRADFDNILIKKSMEYGTHVEFNQHLNNIEFNDSSVSAHFTNKNDETIQVQAKFVVDASGFGRALPQLLDLSEPSDFPSRQAIFCHITDNFPKQFDRKKILVAVHDENPDLWFWVIPFSDGTSSLGVVGEEKYFSELSGDLTQQLKHIIEGSTQLSNFLKDAEYNFEVRKIKGYASNVKSLYGDKFVLLGNAGEFLDPVFSSGVTIALRSATLAAPLIIKQLQGDTVNWEEDFSKELKRGVNTFKAFVESWYTGDLQKIILAPKPDIKIKKMICSILAGYTWDSTNPYTRNSKRRLNTLAQVISQQ